MTTRRDAEAWQQAGDLFDEIVELDAAARAERLARLTDDPSLRRMVEALLAGDAVASTRLPSPGFGACAGVSPPADDPLRLAGMRLGRFRVEAFVAAGGMGMVYRAQDLALRRPVALKFLTPLHGVSSSGRDRLLEEARAAAALDHPNLCPVHDVGESRAGPFLAMPWYAGETLRDRLAREGRLSPSAALAIAEQIAAGLERAHACGIVHRDIKPANIMLLPDGTAKVLDFGLASLPVHGHVAGAPIGTAGYMAPEQRQGGPVDARTDLWALGVVLHEMLIGTPPHRADGARHESASPVADAALEGQRAARRTTRRSAGRQPPDPATASLIDELLRAAPADRPGSAAEVRRRLAALRADADGLISGRARRRIAVTAACLTTAVLLAAGASRTPRASSMTTSDAALPMVVVADLQVGGIDGGDAGLGRLLADEVRRSLADARRALVMSQAQVDSALGRMRLDVSAPLSPAIARDLARREGADAVLTGEVAPLGSGFVVTMRAVAASGGRELAALSATLRQLDVELLPAIERLTDSVAQQLPSMRAEARAIARPVRLTTHSLPALERVRQVQLGGSALPGEHMAALREALAMDSTLAYAWFLMGNMLSGPYRTLLRDSAFTRMYRHREGLSPVEWTQVSAVHLLELEVDRPRAMAAYTALLATDPLEYRVILNAAQLLLGAREWTRAEAHLRRYQSAIPSHEAYALSLAMSYLGQQRAAAADSVAVAVAASLAPDASPAARQLAADLHYRVAVAMRDYPRAAQFTVSDRQLAILARLNGRLAESRRLEARADSALAAFWRVNGVAADPVFTRPLREAAEALWLRSAPAEALSVLDSAFAARPLDGLSEIQHYLDAARAAALYAAAGRPARARAMLDTLLARNDRVTQRAMHQAVERAHGEIALAEGRVPDAMHHFRRSDLAADGLPASACDICVLPLLARAAERAGWRDSARALWTRYAESIAVDVQETDQWFLGMAYERLSVLHAEAGDRVASDAYRARRRALRRAADAAPMP